MVGRGVGWEKFVLKLALEVLLKEAIIRIAGTLFSALKMYTIMALYLMILNTYLKKYTRK